MQGTDSAPIRLNRGGTEVRAGEPILKANQDEAMERDCHSPSETEALAAEFAARLRPGAWVGLIGPLGAGKSVFARAVGREWGVAGPMPSPTFTLMTTHEGRCPVYHIDLYRVSSEDEFAFAGLAPYFPGPGICLVEWADRLPPVWPPSGWTVTITIRSATSRHVVISPFGHQPHHGGST